MELCGTLCDNILRDTFITDDVHLYLVMKVSKDFYTVTNGSIYYALMYIAEMTKKFPGYTFTSYRLHKDLNCNEGNAWRTAQKLHAFGNIKYVKRYDEKGKRKYYPVFWTITERGMAFANDLKEQRGLDE